VPTSSHPDLLDRVLEATRPGLPRIGSVLNRFLRERSPLKALAIWLVHVEGVAAPLTREDVLRLLAQDVARIDRLITGQVNAILHHPDFQRLEASWRGLRYLVQQVPEDASVKVRVLHLPWKELCRDLERALEFDQSQLFRKVYEEEFGTPGGQPFGVLLGDYELRHRVGPGSPTDDMRALARVSAVAAAAFAPFIAGAHPALLELDDFAELEQPLDLTRSFQSVNYLQWRTIRNSEDARFVGLTLPRVLMRLPYDGRRRRDDAFCFREDVERPDRSRYLWGSAVYAFGAVLVRTFAECGWLASIHGLPAPGTLGGGLVTELPVASFDTDPERVAPRPSTDVQLTDRLEKELGELGFIPLCHCPDTDLAVFAGAQSVQKPAKYDEPSATTNARLSSMLQYMLCVARFAHFLKVIARDKVGSFATPESLEDHLNRWLMGYMTSNEADDDETLARYPLREARVQLREHPGKPGSYVCVIHLKPHTQVDQVATTIRLMTELTSGRK
jgi:type VI secretion system ImpC/EvpB family protein